MEAPTEVVLIGTLHEFHLESAGYCPEVLKEILTALEPAAVLKESPPSHMDADGRPVFRSYLHPEGWASDQVAVSLGIPQIPIDRPDRQERFKQTNYFERQERSNAFFKSSGERLQADEPESLAGRIDRLWSQMSQAQVDVLMANPSPEVINSAAFDAIIRAKHDLGDRIVPHLIARSDETRTAMEDIEFLRDEWDERNQIMAVNILSVAAAHRGKRLAVLIGAEHRYALRDLLADAEEVVVREYWEVTNVDLDKARRMCEAPDYGVPVGGLTKAEASAKVTKEYWQATITGDWARVSNLAPGLSAERWQARYADGRPVSLLEIGEPKGAMNLSAPRVRCRIKFDDGQVRDITITPQFLRQQNTLRCYVAHVDES